MGKASLFLYAAAASLLLGGAAPDDVPPTACASLTLVNSLPLTPVPGGARLLVPVTINGARKALLLGMGGLTTIHYAAAQGLGLKLRQTDQRLLDAAGFASTDYVRPEDFTLGSMHAARSDFMITPDRNAGPPGDGVLAAPLHYNFDLEMDFAARQLNYFQPRSCGIRAVYWPTRDIGTVPFTITKRTDNKKRAGAPTTVPFLDGTFSRATLDPYVTELGPGIAGDDLQIRVLLDGKPFTANLDTALEYSVLNSDAARAVFDVDENSPGSAPAASLAQDHAVPGVSETVNVFGEHMFAHTFHTLSFGGVKVTDPRFLVRPDLTGAHDKDNAKLTGSHILEADDNVEPDISIGMDVLRDLHLYFAFQERTLYVTAAAGPR